MEQKEKDRRFKRRLRGRKRNMKAVWINDRGYNRRKKSEDVHVALYYRLRDRKRDTKVAIYKIGRWKSRIKRKVMNATFIGSEIEETNEKNETEVKREHVER